MPKVQVKLFAGLRKHIDGSPSVEVEIEPGATVAEVLDRLGVPTKQARIVFINDRAARPDDALQGDEHIGVFPALGGG